MTRDRFHAHLPHLLATLALLWAARGWLAAAARVLPGVLAVVPFRPACLGVMLVAAVIASLAAMDRVLVPGWRVGR